LLLEIDSVVLREKEKKFDAYPFRLLITGEKSVRFFYYLAFFPKENTCICSIY